VAKKGFGAILLIVGLVAVISGSYFAMPSEQNPETNPYDKFWNPRAKFFLGSYVAVLEFLFSISGVIAVWSGKAQKCSQQKFTRLKSTDFSWTVFRVKQNCSFFRTVCSLRRVKSNLA